MNSLDYIINKYHLDKNAKSPIQIPNVGRDDLAELFKELKFKVGAEIGVASGLYSEILCQANPGLELYCVDPWANYKGYGGFKGVMTQNYQEAKKRLSGHNCHFVRKFSLEAAKDFEDESLDFVYIDGNHKFQNVVNDLCEWSRKVKIGGIVGGHDYIREKRKQYPFPHTSMQVVEAVVGYTTAYGVSPWFLLGNRWPKPGESRDRYRSFMWVRDKFV